MKEKRQGLIGKMNDVSIGDLIKLKQNFNNHKGEVVGYVYEMMPRTIKLSQHNPLYESDIVLDSNLTRGIRRYYLVNMTDREIIEKAKKGNRQRL